MVHLPSFPCCRGHDSGLEKCCVALPCIQCFVMLNFIDEFKRNPGCGSAQEAPHNLTKSSETLGDCRMWCGLYPGRFGPSAWCLLWDVFCHGDKPSQWQPVLASLCKVLHRSYSLLPLGMVPWAGLRPRRVFALEQALKVDRSCKVEGVWGN